MELTAGYPFWLIKNGIPFEYPKLLRNVSCRVVVIGGGISGALTAYHLIEKGIECVLVDGRSIAMGSTCASTSLLQYELDMPLHLLINQIGQMKAVRSYQLCGESIDILTGIMDKIGFDGYQLRKSLYFTTHKQQRSFIEKEFDARNQAGFDVSFLSSNEIGENYGLEAEYAILSQKGATVDAYSLTHALLQYSKKRGLQVFDRTEIHEITYNENKVHLKTGEGFMLTAEKVVNASGFEVVNFISKDIVDLYCTYAVISENSQEQDDFWKDRVMMWNTDNPYLYLRLTMDNRIIIGGRDVRFSHKASRTMFEEKAVRLCADFDKLFPGKKLKAEFAWSGTFGVTKDSLPYIGELSKTPNTYYALGFGGNGITFSAIAARIITDHILGIRNPDSEIFSFSRRSG
jgi:glycine/D-amino acid oxidase-like deaminating enzyme